MHAGTKVISTPSPSTFLGVDAAYWWVTITMIIRSVWRPIFCIIKILANFGFLFALACGKVLQKIFFGPLQPREVEVRFIFSQTFRIEFIYDVLPIIAVIRPDLDVRHRIIIGFHNFPRRVRHSVPSDVWIPVIREVFPLVDGWPDRVGTFCNKTFPIALLTSV